MSSQLQNKTVTAPASANWTKEARLIKRWILERLFLGIQFQTSTFVGGGSGLELVDGMHQRK
jgi:hypothetical protein